ncbi:MAG: ATP-binding protein [Prevotellaceae bacterium]|jgi:hypothetical protein|nr:ATP-binding protein [Prevotellaceae bacterium]
MMKNLPIGTQSFSVLRSTDCLYVDKTADIYRMVTTGRVYFLARPRRFGKSLLVSTLDALFSGQTDLFDGLYIYERWDWSQSCPVVRLDFGSCAFSSVEELKTSLNDFVDATADSYQLLLRENTLLGKFGELIKKLHSATGRRVVILIDEYDKPITDYLSNPEVMTANKRALHDFYQVMKAADEHIRFIFLTGVSKFSGVSVFSALNNLNDITMDDKYASICGYTQTELEACFAEYLDDVANYTGMSRENLLDGIRTWYNGYSWDGETSVYNPFSTLLFFDKKRFSNYWFRTGTPTFLVNLIKERNRIAPVLKPVIIDESSFESYNPANIGEIPLLFQTGYLTVRHRELHDGQAQYTLDIPNQEVKESILRHLLGAYSAYPVEEVQPLIFEMRRQIYEGDSSGLEQNLRMLLANIPHNLHVPKEAYYHSLFLLWMRMLGFDIQGEVLTNIGRIDAVWHQAGLTVVTEIKFHSDKNIDDLLGEAMAQINDRRYYEAYHDRQVILMAIAFTGKEVKCLMKY